MTIHITISNYNHDKLNLLKLATVYKSQSGIFGCFFGVRVNWITDKSKHFITLVQYCHKAVPFTDLQCKPQWSNTATDIKGVAAVGQMVLENV